MREILFKAKRLDNGEWVCWNIYGELCRLSGKRTRLAIKNGATTHYYDYIYQVIERIDKNTICQYTGLTDKNGNKIWENDILSYENTKGIIKFKDGCFLYKWKNFVRYRSDFFKECILKNFGYFRELGVIGNFFDNQDLLQ